MIVAISLHFYFNFTQPLIIQTCNQIVGLYLSPFVQVHHYGFPATGRLARPWSYNSIINSIYALTYTMESNPPVTEFNDEILKIEKKSDQPSSIQNLAEPSSETGTVKSLIKDDEKVQSASTAVNDSSSTLRQRS
ncbi:hypothetical protein AYI68_g2389 [Smittium mucronatum]|uniref:Uncharacterized protein n=1 Tax=Smittium mucronatum TaxID=133383 RepID=A0A1R0H2V9_9FUNG|nr:hypothetical protein AYI68_g2389 [Smittium mucronatum]